MKECESLGTLYLLLAPDIILIIDDISIPEIFKFDIGFFL
jgi:hypothetical protein